MTTIEKLKQYIAATFEDITPDEIEKMVEALLDEMWIHNMDDAKLVKLLSDIREDQAYENTIRPTATG